MTKYKYLYGAKTKQTLPHITSVEQKKKQKIKLDDGIIGIEPKKFYYFFVRPEILDIQYLADHK